MADDNTTSVSAAFEILMEEMETEIALAHQVGSRALEASDYARAREVINQAENLTELRGQLAVLQNKWNAHTVDYTEQEEDESGGFERRNLGRLQRGLRTPEKAFYVPILTVLDRLGGSGSTRAVVDLVEAEMKGVLRDVDYELLPTEPVTQRWRNTTQWARYQMVQDGLLKADSPRGVWEISDAGRQFLAKQGN